MYAVAYGTKFALNEIFQTFQCDCFNLHPKPKLIMNSQTSQIAMFGDNFQWDFFYFQWNFSHDFFLNICACRVTYSLNILWIFKNQSNFRVYIKKIETFSNTWMGCCTPTLKLFYLINYISFKFVYNAAFWISEYFIFRKPLF